MYFVSSIFIRSQYNLPLCWWTDSLATFYRNRICKDWRRRYDWLMIFSLSILRLTHSISCWEKSVRQSHWFHFQGEWHHRWTSHMFLLQQYCNIAIRPLTFKCFQVLVELQNDFFPNFMLCTTTQRFVRSSKPPKRPIKRPSPPFADPCFLFGNTVSLYMITSLTVILELFIEIRVGCLSFLMMISCVCCLLAGPERGSWGCSRASQQVFWSSSHVRCCEIIGISLASMACSSTARLLVTKG